MDKLEKIFQMQDALDSKIVNERNLNNIDMNEWVQKEILAIMSELNEILGEINWKWWKNPKEINKDNLKEEIIDILHFFISLCLKVGMNAEEVFEIYMNKNKENVDRQNGDSSKLGYAVKNK